MRDNDIQLNFKYINNSYTQNHILVQNVKIASMSIIYEMTKVIFKLHHDDILFMITSTIIRSINWILLLK